MAKSRGRRKKPASSRTPLWLPLGGLALIVLALFSRSLNSGFLYDSIGELEIWDFLHHSANLLPVLTFHVMSLDVLDFNRPVELASLMFDSLLWDRNPFGYHLTSIVLHAAVAGLVFLFVRHVLSLGKNPAAPGSWVTLPAFFAALLFAVHPVVIEAVCEPSNRKDILATLFGLGAFLVVIRHRADSTQGDLLRLFLCCLLCLLSIGSKEVGIAFPPVLFLYWLLFRRHEPARYWVMVIAGSSLVVLAFLIARFRLAHHPSEIFVAEPSYPGGSLLQALLIQPRIFVFYLTNLFWPFHLCADENGYTIRNIFLAPSLFLLAGVAAGLVWWSLRDARVLFAGGLLVAALLPVSNLVPIYHPLADRYLYLPLAAMVLLLAIALQSRGISERPVPRKMAVTALVAITLFFSAVTWHQEGIWSNGVSLWTATLEENPSSLAANLNLPETLMLAGRLDEAKAQYEHALGTPYKTLPQPWFGYAVVLHRLGDIPQAQRAARQAVAIKPILADPAWRNPQLEYLPDLRHEFLQILAEPPASP